MKNEQQSAVAMPVRSLQRVMTIVRPVIDRNPTIPALGMVRIEPKVGEVEFAASNQVLSVRARRMLDGTRPASAMLLPALKLDGYARLLDGRTVTIAAADALRASLRSGGAAARLPLMSASAYPYLEPVPEVWSATVRQDVFASMLHGTTFAASADEAQTNLRGVLLEIRDGRLHMVATDGHRLAHQSVPATTPAVSIFLPQELVEVQERTVDKNSDGTCSFAATEERIFACFRDSAGAERGSWSVEIVQRINPTRFPNYQAVLPTKAEVSVRVSVSALVSALRRCVSFADAKSQAVRISVSRGEIKVAASTADAGDAVEVLQVCGRNPFPPINALFRGEYLLDVLTRTYGEVMLHFAKVGPASALWVVDSSEAGESAEYVVMALNG